MHCKITNRNTTTIRNPQRLSRLLLTSPQHNIASHIGMASDHPTLGCPLPALAGGPVYLDYNATTPCFPEVRMDCSFVGFGNMLAHTCQKGQGPCGPTSPQEQHYEMICAAGILRYHLIYHLIRLCCQAWLQTNTVVLTYTQAVLFPQITHQSAGFKFFQTAA